MQKWVNYQFESSTTKTPEFKSFARDFKKAFKHLLGDDYHIEMSVNHFYISGFIAKDGKFIYFSTSDVRFFPNEWYNKLLIRTSKDMSDYTGGPNNYTSINHLKENVNRLLSY